MNIQCKGQSDRSVSAYVHLVFCFYTKYGLGIGGILF